MRNSFILSMLAGIVIAALCLPAMADVNMYFSGTAGNSYQGVPSYPYYLSVDGGALQAMMCLGYTEHISGGETWMATVTSVGSLDPVAQAVDYQAAFLFTKAIADHGADSDLNAAIWYLFEGVPSPDAGVLAYIALAQSQTYFPGEFSGIFLYSAIPGTESGSLGTAQNFFGTPEPTSLLLTGSGLMTLAAALRRKLS